MGSVRLPRDLGTRRKSGRVPRNLPYVVAEIVLLALLGWAVARLFWTMLTTVAPIGLWPQPASGAAIADRSLLARFDPFFRLADAGGPAVVTSLPLKLTGTRVDQAMGRGSAIILTPDGQQASFAVGDTIVPGVTLKSVAFDSVTVDRGGVSEQLFIDQSKPAEVAGAGAPTAVAQPPAGAPSVGVAPPPVAQRSPSAQGPGQPPPRPPGPNLGAALAPRIEKGAVTGLVVSPQGSGGLAAAAGMQAGDVLISVNGTAIHSPEDAARIAVGLPANGDVSFSVDRGGKIITLTTKVPK